MDYEAYRKAYFADPEPPQQFAFTGITGAALYIESYQAAVEFYSQVLGPPVYVEGEWTRSWQLGETWLTLLKGQKGGPGNVEIILTVKTIPEVERLYQAFVSAGASGEAPSDQIMGEPVRFSMVEDPFGTVWVIICPLDEA